MRDQEIEKAGPEAVAAWNRARAASEKLFDALDSLEELGGLPAAAAAGGWSPKSLDRALANLRATRDAIDAQIEPRRSPLPPRRDLVVPLRRASARS